MFEDIAVPFILKNKKIDKTIYLWYNTYIIIKGEKYDWTKNKRLFKRYRSL